MNLLRLFTDKAPNKVFLSMLLGAVAGIGYSLLIPLVLVSIAPGSGEEGLGTNMVRRFLWMEVSNYKFALLFVLVCLVVLCCRSVSQILLTRVALDATTELRVTTYRKIMRAPIAELEKMGSSKLLVAITTDVARIVMGATVLPNVLVCLVTLAGMLGYLYILSSEVFWLVIKAMVFGVVTYQVPMFIGNKYFERGRAKIDALQESIRGLIYGTKELKLSKVKRDRYFNEILLANERAVLGNTKLANTIVVASANYGDLLCFFVVGLLAYVFVSSHSITTQTLVGTIMALLYITGPVALILNSMPQIAMAKVSLRNITRVFSALSKEEADEEIKPLPEWDAVRFSNVSYHYTDEDGGFTLGPLDMEVAKGEITFIVGGNGSGKSTLCKLLALHYTPTDGDIYFGGVKMDRKSLNSGRQYISAIFTDYYLFDRLLSNLQELDEKLVNRYLSELEIDRKVKVENGRFSTLALSDGQRKRLALLVTFLEDRDVYIFDEWAADQDPMFKQVFYHHILPELKARNKVVVVISHDDRFFNVADKLLIMEEGKLIRTERLRSELREPLALGTDAVV
ncbi:MAG TPA: cyclic peptide export ABC transporter [Pyrinomonadaceae bacterium]|nr:cyclic peptide export ABC transporter [Pyrinomonadaceae bacterium]